MEKIEHYPLIAKRIAWLRNELCNLSQRQFATRIGVKQNHTISEYERGVSRPDFRRCKAMIDLAKEYGKDISFEWLRPDLY